MSAVANFQKLILMLEARLERQEAGVEETRTQLEQARRVLAAEQKK